MSTQQERAELHKTIWKIANDLRGGFFVSALLTVVVGLLLCSCTKETLRQVQDSKAVEPVETPTSTDLPTDTVYSGISIDTAWLRDTIIFSKP